MSQIQPSVFISYSRKDTDFARRLFDALEASGRDSWIDWEGLRGDVRWWQEIQTNIDAADTFVFIMTPDSLASAVCTLELAHALARSKRIVPVVRVALKIETALGHIAAVQPDDVLRAMLGERDLLIVARNNWRELGHINWIFFRESDDFQKAFETLTGVIETDRPHVKTHTRLLVRAKEWDVNHDSSLLLRGDDLRQAES